MTGGAIDLKVVGDRLQIVADALGRLHLAARFLEIAGFRNRLTHFYDEVTADELLRVRASHLDDLEALAAALRAAASGLAR